ncbi:hypothetical protein VNO78_37473 [Psophocarpus tetragonolobus]|uniref:Uncharacterized protein n=1 Tax=Psophocarpus tetragonolobus TaxID=3891 RepID=A0AAN9NDU7_PSOTE
MYDSPGTCEASLITSPVVQFSLGANLAKLSHTTGVALRPLVEWPFAPAPVGTVPFSSLRLLGQLLVASILTFPIPWLQTADGNLDESSNGDVYKGSSQTELLSRVAEAELEELVLSTLAAFFAIASVEWLRGELKLLRHSAMEMVLHTEDLSPRSTKEMNEWKTARGIPNCHAGFLYQHSLQAESKTDLKTEWKTHEVKKPDCEEVQAKEMGTYTITIDRQQEQFQDLAAVHSYRTPAILYRVEHVL